MVVKALLTAEKENIVILQLVLKVLMKLLYMKLEERFALEVMG